MWDYNYDYLCHYGILGQKWGIRRYQNYDGSYTQAGLKRYEKSRNEYEKNKNEYINAKESGNKVKIANAKINMKASKRKMNKDYKHLKLDKQADKGKILYSEGYRITGKNQVLQAMKTVGGLSLAAVGLAKYGGGNIPIGGTGINVKMPRDVQSAIIKNDKALALGAAATIGAAYVADIVTRLKDRNLRAYYSHTSNY